MKVTVSEARFLRIRLTGVEISHICLQFCHPFIYLRFIRLLFFLPVYLPAVLVRRYAAGVVPTMSRKVR